MYVWILVKSKFELHELSKHCIKFSLEYTILHFPRKLYVISFSLLYFAEIWNNSVNNFIKNLHHFHFFRSSSKLLRSLRQINRVQMNYIMLSWQYRETVRPVAAYHWVINKYHRRQLQHRQQGTMKLSIQTQKIHCQISCRHTITLRNPQYMLKLIILKHCNTNHTHQRQQQQQRQHHHRWQTVHPHQMLINCIIKMQRQQHQNNNKVINITSNKLNLIHNYNTEAIVVTICAIAIIVWEVAVVLH